MASPIGAKVPLCGAKSKRSGNRCQNRAMENGRCRFHGGKSTGAPAGNVNAVTHGIYSNALRGDEKAQWERIPLGGLDDEIKMLRLRLKRIFEEQARADDDPLAEKTLELRRVARASSKSSSEASGDGDKKSPSDKSESSSSRSIELVRPDYRLLVLAYTRRIAELEDKRRILIAGGEKSLVEGGITVIIRKFSDEPTPPVVPNKS